MVATCATVLTIALSAVAFAQVVGTSPAPREVKCQFSQYFDEATADCEPCREICHDAKIKGTGEMCEKECSDYARALNCTADEYYDDVVHSCAPCSELCDARVIKKTSDDCYNKCKAYNDRKRDREEGRLPENKQSSVQRVSAGVKPPVSAKGEESSVSTENIVVIVIVAATVVVLAVILAFLAVLLWRRQGKRQQEGTYTVASQEETTGLPDDNRPEAVVALLFGEALREDFGPSFPAVSDGSEANGGTQTSSSPEKHLACVMTGPG